MTLFLVDYPKERSAATFHGYRILSRAAFGNPQAERLARLLDMPSTYYYDGPACHSPGAALTLTGEAGTFDLIICFQCHNVAPFTPGAEGLHPLSDEGTEQLRALFIKAFPEAARQLLHGS